jgi:hypothetical protein
MNERINEGEMNDVPCVWAKASSWARAQALRRRVMLLSHSVIEAAGKPEAGDEPFLVFEIYLI